MDGKRLHYFRMGTVTAIHPGTGDLLPARPGPTSGDGTICSSTTAIKTGGKDKGLIGITDTGDIVPGGITAD
jgi:hypothetical protein